MSFHYGSTRYFGEGGLPTSRPSNLPFGWGDLGDWVLDQAGRWVQARLTPGAPEPEHTSPGGCPSGQVGIFPNCFDVQPGGGTQGGGMWISGGEAVMGRYGAGMQPAQRSAVVRMCPQGAVLGNDGLCYNKRDLRRTDRKWIPPRKPLLTGGDLNAIARAARAANKLKTQQKRLQKLGMLPKPSSSRRGARPKMIGSGAHPITVIDT